ncbi:hypothetical protein BACI349Y_900009 [Bacillus sp. 349Y]|nr:hypothetical protein BACI349Y_900009 [Bacillus sp. 349Y]
MPHKIQCHSPCCLLRHQEGLGEVSLSTPYPPFGPVPLTDAIRGSLAFARGYPYLDPRKVKNRLETLLMRLRTHFLYGV